MMIVLAAVMSLAVNCHPTPPDPPEPPDPPDPPTVIIDSSYDFETEGGTVTLTMNMSEDWTAKVSGGGNWCTLSQSSGPAGDAVVVITVAANDTYVGRDCTVKISSEHSVGNISIHQAQLDVLAADPGHFDAPAEGGEYTPDIMANVSYEVTVDAEWLSWEDGKIIVTANEAEEARSANVTLAGERLSATVTISQEGQLPPDPPDPLDGIVAQIQEHTEGAGIPIVFMGDAFSGEDIEGGLYATLMQQAAEALFTVEPYATFRSLFDLYTVTVVSPYYEDFNQGGSTTLGTYFRDGTYVNGNHDKCREYALKAVPEEIMDDVLVVILMNRPVHAGRCYMQIVSTIIDGQESTADDCTHGIAFAYLALGTDVDDFAGLVRHEAGGHGFGRLADEYFYEGTGALPQSVAEQYKSMQTLNHAYMNVDFVSGSEEVIWSKFLQDERYQYDGLGVFEGACTYQTGAWRPSETSIMVSNEGRFNAPSREAIYFRMHKLAYGRDWEYDYETFVGYDAVNRLKEPEDEPHAAPTRRRASCGYTPCPPPEIIR